MHGRSRNTVSCFSQNKIPFFSQPRTWNAGLMLFCIFVNMRQVYVVIAFSVLLVSCSSSNSQPPPDTLKQAAPGQDSVVAEQEIALLPFDRIDSHYVRLAAKELSAFYRCHVTLLDARALPKQAYYAPRNRYKADSLISWLAKEAPGKYDRIVGITEKDISTEKDPYEDWGIMGLAYCPGKSCVVSTFRLKKNVTQSKIDERFAKVVLHEAGHTFGLQHCRSGDTTCFMEDADGTIRSVDREKKQLCVSCREKVKSNLR